ncbi:MAG: Glyceraldehyde-3-phosphate dehydrogenase/erythrose-4-phosphate dehydrogenase [Candidatus Roizmanbacteria bacterium GW2011_GWC2_37_13]|uniref:Glyceraldehyde-3-phosphate dehydrogenase/erythrose-4-phosphate dehydrogenase n=1 Tax=Candidatus Roizmanbacteria bacterium GW2011_GWC2_37_13 TaxID=1618486 RepID=A0A0G0G649_9BACT|nr:MAG: Glyceraldehyde-3-phosphate dehydrogenase/erythrose-4-phosphate dehydrogenase [Candidatus Roizmanbacteria bacterium GW2011_GWC1_37_12]KKQ25532.1 MAG: Glyceraldehyde-3-phosphate dehydrogenase/erythrose-4-phosphate dehydrogenase [Candidatus Roizmanbacteria bacterium GW2011_GWC2_37_13]
MKKIKVGLNGFGRIGRAFARIALSRDTFDLVVINTRKTQNSMMSYLLQYDSVYRTFGKVVKEETDGISIEGKKILTLLNDKPENIPWNKYQVDVVVDATGAFPKKPDLEKHLKGSVKKVILSAPAKDEETPFVVQGVNDSKFDFKKESIISMASCTTNCAAPMFKVINDNFKVVSGFLTTVHAITISQSMLDDANKNEGRSRAAFTNIIPSTTGAAKAVARVIPELKGKVDGMALRVPIATGSITDISAIVEKHVTAEEVNKVFKEASLGAMKEVLRYENKILVSSDYIGSPFSCIFDANYTKVINGLPAQAGNLVKIFGWYDNEWGYSTRLVDLVEKLTNYV